MLHGLAAIPSKPPTGHVHAARPFHVFDIPAATGKLITMNTAPSLAELHIARAEEIARRAAHVLPPSEVVTVRTHVLTALQNGAPERHAVAVAVRMLGLMHAHRTIARDRFAETARLLHGGAPILGYVVGSEGLRPINAAHIVATFPGSISSALAGMRRTGEGALWSRAAEREGSGRLRSRMPRRDPRDDVPASVYARYPMGYPRHVVEAHSLIAISGVLRAGNRVK